MNWVNLYVTLAMEEGERRYGAGWSESKRRSSVRTLDFQIVPVERNALLGWTQDVIPQVLSNLGERDTVIEQKSYIIQSSKYRTMDI